MKESSIKETFRLLDVRAEGAFTLNDLQHVLQEEFSNCGDSGASIGQDAQVWLHITEELEKDGERPISYSDFYDAVLTVLQRNFVEEIAPTTKRDKGLR